MSSQIIPMPLGRYVPANVPMEPWVVRDSPQIPPVQFFNIPINIYTAVIGPFAADIKDIASRLNRHEDLLQEIFEMVKVIEVETRRLNPDTIDDLTDAAESELGELLNSVREKRFPGSPDQEIQAMLARAI